MIEIFFCGWFGWMQTVRHHKPRLTAHKNYHYTQNAFDSSKQQSCPKEVVLSCSCTSCHTRQPISIESITIGILLLLVTLCGHSCSWVLCRQWETNLWLSDHEECIQSIHQWIRASFCYYCLSIPSCFFMGQKHKHNYWVSCLWVKIIKKVSG